MTFHIATSPYVADGVRKALRVPVSTVPDGWMMGPSALDLERQMRIRAEYWDRIWPHPHPGYCTPHSKTLRTLAAGARVVIWMSPAFEERVALWAFCAHRLRHRPTRPALSLVVVGERVSTAPPRLFNDGYFRVNPTIVRRARRTERPLSLDEVREKARFWERLAADSPVLSGEPIPETHSNKELIEMGTYQASFFPRRAERGFALSTFDAAMLGAVDEIPATPARIIVGKNYEGSELEKWMHLTGDIIIFYRLAEWAKYGALHAEPHTTPNGVLTALYTITDAGRAILRDGLPSIDQAPPIPIWGVTAYDPKNPWVVVEEPGGRPWLRRLGE